ncbi:hypothetical protein [Streptomyces sp. NPDC002640]
MPTRRMMYRFEPAYVQHDAVPHRIRQAAMDVDGRVAIAEALQVSPLALLQGPRAT